ncbi:MAG: hypothetical protein P0120_19100 [Nitrospira sp.]|nr:hypothetical protein [Nitrospira sp.]
MPTSVPIVIAVLGALLVLLGLATSTIKIFGAEIGPLRNKAMHRWVISGGVLALFTALLISAEKQERSSPPPGPVVVNNNPVIINNQQPQLPQTHAGDTATANYLSIWQCIAPVYRPEDQDLAVVKPDQSQLLNGLLDMTFGGETGCVQVLLNAGADINGYRFPRKGNFLDGPALHLFLRQRQWSIALMLLESGANPNLLTSSAGTSAHDEACGSLGVPEYVMQALRDKGAKPVQYGKCKGI